MFNVVLVEPEIPPNTGNVIRLCANTGACLHLVGPLGFSLEDKLLRRAGLDYREYATLKTHPDFPTLMASERPQPHRMFAFSSAADAPFADQRFEPGDWLVFGSETRGLAPQLRVLFPPAHRLRLPMRPGMRSLNLSNAVAVVVYEAWRQNGFEGGI